MKIIGIVENKKYIAEISHAEIEKFLDLFYRGKGLKELTVGETVDLGKGHDYARDIGEAMRKVQEMISSNQAVISAILNGMNIVRILADESSQEEKKCSSST